MMTSPKCMLRWRSAVAFSLLSWLFGPSSVHANPTGGTVAQGSASFNSSGSQLTITTSANAYINWQSFNIGAGETTTFVQPSDTSVVWNQINSSSPSQILGNLNANGYVILQNQSGFYVGGQASVTAHGLILTTASAAPNLSSGGAWEFNAPPPTAKIINYGQISLAGGGSVFLIANDIENNGTISAPQGNIGLYAGKEVLVSMSPDGRGLSAKLTLPQGSVDNEGNLIADGGTIAAQAQTINQNGLVQANSVQNVNGTIELVAGDSLSLGASSTISAQGAALGVSSGGSVTIQSGGTFSDQIGSAINISGGAQGGNGGKVEISAPEMTSIQSAINGQAATGYVNGELTIDPLNIQLVSSGGTGTAGQYSSGTVNPSDPPTGDTLVLNVNSFSSTLSEINLQAINNIELSTIWTLTDPGVPASLNLTAGNSIILDDGSGISAGHNWSVNLAAGTAFVSTGSQSAPPSGNDGIYLNGSAYIQAVNGNINLSAANDVLVNSGEITTSGGGNINVMAQYGDVNTGSNPGGFSYVRTAPYYTVIASALGGISTADGGNVNITAGGDVTSFMPLGSSAVAEADGGTGAFGAAPGNVTITAGGSIYGHYVLANGIGTLTAGVNVGDGSGENFALSLIAGTWNVNAPNGNIYLQEVLNPNGVFNNVVGLPVKGVVNPAGQHLFNYSLDAAVDLTAGDGVYLTDTDIQRPDGGVPVLYPPILDISAGSGGVNLGGDITLFPSPDQNLTITTTDGGNLVSPVGATTDLFMSDSSQTRWLNQNTFSTADNSAGLPAQSSDPNPVLINISGSMENLTLITSKETDLTVDGDMINCNFSGQNLNANNVTSITVGGQIYNQSAYTYVNGVSIPSIPLSDLFPGMGSSWDNAIFLAMNPTALANLPVPPAGTSPAHYLQLALAASLFGTTISPNGQWVIQGPTDLGFVYNPTTGQLGFGGPMAPNYLTALSGPITILKLANGVPILDASGHFETQTINWAPPTDVQTLFTDSQSDPSPNSPQMGYRLGGPGVFDIDAGSISLGDSYGILSVGVFDPDGGLGRFENLASVTPSGATLNVTVAGDLNMVASTIATLGGGNLNLTSTGGSLDLGSEGLANSILQVGYGVYTAGSGNVNVTALGDVNIDGSRIAAYDGGNIFVESLEGNVDVGSGGDTPNGVFFSYVDPLTGQAESYPEKVFGSGIVATTFVPSIADLGYPPDYGQSIASAPGDITVDVPRGDITATVGGITQITQSGVNPSGPTITLTAGTLPSGTVGAPGYSPGYTGNIDLGESGVIGGSVNITANGNVSGLIVSRQNSDINAAQSFTGSVLSGGQANVAAGDSVGGLVVGANGASVSGGSVTATVLGQNVSVNGGASQSTLGSSATASSTSQSAAQQSSVDTKSELATDDSDSDDEKKKKKDHPLMQHVKRVTVILPKT